ncbi:hypothetical protein CXG81DRAFT_17821 [Caulochytrium protostelioides]|uniref:Uncharacterized protein n=1 Tax=Caulochytrium protostelioides TaxID=1555241 RepID=A0A4P9XB20_9FUNG|nr:hypothetical protein CXG81DRAFT_17821 [Caulochytrium protostelioides]|eukprot:RKP02545.1 hypothetical protein CXG81DRAFT_17821 [Caulochytrium protostelioides]
MADLDDLRVVFESYANFGASRNVASNGSLNNLAGPQLDNAKFAKLCRETKVVDGKRITTTEIDISFSKVLKGGRKMDFGQFQEVLRLLAEKKFGGAVDAQQKLIAQICQSKGPKASGTTPDAKGAHNRLTDTSQYTGTHKLRFDEEGRGRGLAGRDAPAPTADLSQILDRSGATVRGVPLKTAERTANTTATAAGTRRTATQRTPLGSQGSLSASTPPPKRVTPTPSTSTRPAAAKTAAASKAAATKTAGKAYAASSPAGGSVFDRLTNTAGYTGSHKERFNADGTGRGLAGREAPNKSGAPGTYRGGNVSDLSQILRT